MKRLLFALLAILTGLAATGTPVLAAVEAQSSAAIGVPRNGDTAECRTAGRCTIPVSVPSDDVRAQALFPATPTEPATPAVRLKADRARE